jgi:hypothetical protein
MLAAGTLMTAAFGIVPLGVGMMLKDGRPDEVASHAIYFAAMQFALGMGALVCGVADHRRKGGFGPSGAFATIGLFVAALAVPAWYLLPATASLFFVDWGAMAPIVR